jgi:hypothetical protein
MIQTGSIEPIQLDGAVQPTMDQFIRSSESTANTVNICWNSDQNTAFAMNIGMKARTRLRSIAVTFALASITTKYATEAAMMTPVVTCDRLDSLTNPVTKATTMTATTTTTNPATHPIALCGNWLGTVRPCAPRFRRNADVLGKTQCHADCRGTEAEVESGVSLQQAGDQWADEGTEVDAEIKQGEATVAAGIALLVQGSQQ